MDGLWKRVNEATGEDVTNAVMRAVQRYSAISGNPSILVLLECFASAKVIHEELREVLSDFPDAIPVVEGMLAQMLIGSVLQSDTAGDEPKITEADLEDFLKFVDEYEKGM